MTNITVMGAAEARVPADQADIFASVSSRDASREIALQGANAAHAKLVERAKELVSAGSAIQYVADPVSTYSNSWRDEHGNNVVEHQAHASVQIVLSALDRVGEVAAELTESGADVRVQWELSSALRDEWTRNLRSAAVQDARTAAEDFSVAIGAPTLTLLTLRDGRSGGGPSPLGDARFAMAAAAPPEVTVGQISVNVQVEATFNAE
ncbi:SIMPL domain-containing protein [Leucobacter sp. NPDC015123]|uniref:SIMPL domain-containing protein n=1 Tax=Leucobacter sp. NPDC015123 TaxID=3364129 RepID=UPI0036F495AB